jgi:hypothetical protein
MSAGITRAVEKFCLLDRGGGQIVGRGTLRRGWDAMRRQVATYPTAGALRVVTRIAQARFGLR